MTVPQTIVVAFTTTLHGSDEIHLGDFKEERKGKGLVTDKRVRSMKKKNLNEMQR